MTAFVDQRPGRARDVWRRYGVDVAVALVVTAAQVGFSYGAAKHHGHAVSALGYALLAVSGLALIWRRRFIAAVLAVTLVTTLWSATTADPGGPIWGAVVVAFGTAIYYRKRAVAILSLVAGYVGSIWLPALTGPHKAPPATFDLSLAVGLLVLLGGAEGIRFRHERADAQRHIKEEEARRVASEERVRIARDLHDVVGHSVSVMTVQASGVRRLLRPEQEREREALLIVEQTGREALAEMRRLVGVLRRPEEAPALAPQPSLQHLDKLVDQVRESGLTVGLTVEGEPESLSASVDLAAYRLVQEGLTNTLKHAKAQRAEVFVRYGNGEVEVVVADDGNGTGGGDGGGHGLVGLRERIAVAGGELDAGPRTGGGFQVRARLPMNGK